MEKASCSTAKHTVFSIHPHQSSFLANCKTELYSTFHRSRQMDCHIKPLTMKNKITVGEINCWRRLQKRDTDFKTHYLHATITEGISEEQCSSCCESSDLMTCMVLLGSAFRTLWLLRKNRKHAATGNPPGMGKQNRHWLYNIFSVIYFQD